MKTARDSERQGLNRRDVFKAIPVFVPVLSSLVVDDMPSSASEAASGFENLERAVSKVKRTTLREDLRTQLGKMEVARVANNREELSVGFQRLSWFIVHLRNTLSPAVRQRLLKNLLLDAAKNHIDLPNAVVARREMQTSHPALG